MHLHKFVSNENVLDGVPEEDRASGSIPHMIIGEGAHVVKNVLGVQWCLENDTLGFRIMLQDKPLTRRGLLSTVCSVYDPLDFLAPIVLTGKQMLQQLCKDNLD